MKKLLDALEKFEAARGWDAYNRIETDEERLLELRNTAFYLIGELGELANEIKKGIRDQKYNDEHIKEEITDVFMFLMKLSRIAKMDLEAEFYKKLAHNEERFAHFVK